MDEDSESAFDPAHIKYEIIEKVVKATFAEKGSPNPETGEAMYVEWSDSKRDSWVKDIIEGVLAKLAIFNEELAKQEGASVFKFVGAARPRPRPTPLWSPAHPWQSAEAASPSAASPSCASPVVAAVTASVQQKYGASLHTSTAQYWDTTTDGAPAASLADTALWSFSQHALRLPPYRAITGHVPPPDLPHTLHIHLHPTPPSPLCLAAYTSLSWECDQIQCVVMVFGVQN